MPFASLGASSSLPLILAPHSAAIINLMGVFCFKLQYDSGASENNLKGNHERGTLTQLKL